MRSFNLQLSSVSVQFSFYQLLDDACGIAVLSLYVSVQISQHWSLHDLLRNARRQDPIRFGFDELHVDLCLKRTEKDRSCQVI